MFIFIWQLAILDCGANYCILVCGLFFCGVPLGSPSTTFGRNGLPRAYCKYLLGLSSFRAVLSIIAAKLLSHLFDEVLSLTSEQYVGAVSATGDARLLHVQEADEFSRSRRGTRILYEYRTSHILMNEQHDGCLLVFLSLTYRFRLQTD